MHCYKGLFAASGLLLTVIATPALAQSINSYTSNTLTSGITVTANNSKFNAATLFGLKVGSTVTFAKGSAAESAGGTFNLIDVSKFVLILNPGTNPGITADDTTGLTSSEEVDTPSKVNQWTGIPFSSGSYLGWDSGQSGSDKSGQLLPSTSTGNIFQLSGMLPKGYSIQYFGMDIAWTDHGSTKTGHVILGTPPPPAPETSTIAGFGCLGAASLLGLLRKRRRA